MNNTVTLSQLITRLAKATGVDNNTARRFLRSFFDTLEETLEQEQTVTVKNFGTFRRTNPADPGTKGPVAFVPDPAIMEELNKPFEMFEPVELADGVDFSEVDAAEVAPAEEPAAIETPVPVEVPVVEEEQKKVYTYPEEEEEEKEAEAPKAEALPEPKPEPKPQPEPEPQPEPKPQPKPQPRQQRHHHHYVPEPRKFPLWGWFVIFVVVASIVGFFAATWTTPMPVYDYDDYGVSQSPATSDSSATTTTAPDTATAITPTQPQAKPEAPAVPVAKPVKQAEPTTAPAATSSEPVYDTVEVSLIRLARRHYGVSEFWVFIFEANQDKIKNPNTIRPGTRVVIPDRSTLPGATLEETKSIAKKKQSEYQRKFN